MSLHYQSTNGLQGVVKTNKGIEIRNARLNVKNATPGLSFNGNDELVNEWYARQAGSDVDMGSNKITNLGAPSQPQDATSKNYVDSLAGTPALKESLRVYYSFDGDYKDSTSNNYDGTPNNNVSFVTGKINQGIEFPGNNIDDYISVVDAFDVQDKDFTVSLWLYPKGNSKQCYPVVNTAGGNTRFFVIYQPSGNFRFFTEASGSTDDINTDPVYTTINQWYHVVAQREGTTGRIYVNGHLAKTGTVQGGVISTAGGNSFVGRPSNSEDNYKVDEMGVWNRVLSQGEIIHLYNSGSANAYLSTYDWFAIKQNNHINMNDYRITNIGKTLNGSDVVDKAYVDSRAPMSQLEQGTRAYYTLDGNYIDSVNDYDGTEQGGGSLSFSSTAKLGQSVEFFGSSGDYVDFGGGAFDFGTNDFTISLWIRLKSFDGYVWTTALDSQNRIILGFGNQDEFRLIVDDSNTLNDYLTGSPLILEQWYHVVVVREGTNYRLYQNNTKQIDVTDSNSNLTGNISYLGALDTGGNNPHCYFDEVGAWERALTENEIKYLYHEGLGTNDFVSYDYTMNYDVDMNQNQILNLGSAQTSSLTISDDAVSTISPPNNQGVMMASADSGVIVAFYDVGNGATSFIQQYGSVFNDAGGTDLTGSTGNDGTINISSNSGEIHIENRSGSQTTVRLLNIF